VKKQGRQPILDPAKIAAGGIASPLAALLTSRFGVAGTLLGGAFASRRDSLQMGVRNDER
jgi:pyridoxal biosynthesis lyase PdxS